MDQGLRQYFNAQEGIKVGQMPQLPPEYGELGAIVDAFNKVEDQLTDMTDELFRMKSYSVINEFTLCFAEGIPNTLDSVYSLAVRSYSAQGFKADGGDTFFGIRLTKKPCLEVSVTISEYKANEYLVTEQISHHAVKLGNRDN